MDGHQVMAFVARLRKLPLQEFVERFQVVDSPLLPCTHLTQITPQVDEPQSAFMLDALHRNDHFSESTLFTRLRMKLSWVVY